MIATNPLEHFTELKKMRECNAGMYIIYRSTGNFGEQNI